MGAQYPAKSPSGPAGGDLGGSFPNPTVPTVKGGKTPLSTDQVGTGAGTVAAGNDSRITGAEQTANKGVANGYASLDSGLLVPLAQIPSLPESRITGLTADLAATEKTANKAQPSGYASLDGSGKVPSGQLPASAGTASPGIWIPPGWGAFWKAKLRSAGSGVARLAIVGDSISQGFLSSDLDAKSWAGLLTSALQTTWGDGGSGYKGAAFSPTFVTAAAGSTLNTYYAGKSNLWTVAGAGWTTQRSGVGGIALKSVTTGNSITATFRGTTLNMWTIDGAGFSQWTYQIDGGSVVTITPGASNVTVQRQVTGLAPGAHTVVITPTQAATFFFNGLAGENSTGVIVDRYGAYGDTSSRYVLPDTYQAAAYSGGYQHPADLVIYAMGANDVNAPSAGDAFAKNVRQYVDQAKNAGTSQGAVDLLFLLPHVGTNDTTNYLFSDYAGRYRGLADAYGAAFVDIWALGRNSWNYFNSLSYWGSGANPVVSGTDSVHPGDAGHAYIESVLAPIVATT